MPSINFGIGVAYSIQLQYLHPRRSNEEKFWNKGTKNRIERLLVIIVDSRKINCI